MRKIPGNIWQPSESLLVDQLLAHWHTAGNWFGLLLLIDESIKIPLLLCLVSAPNLLPSEAL
jgi:hypothetical protein